MATKNKYQAGQRRLLQWYKKMYPEISFNGLNVPLPGVTLDEVTMPEFYSDIAPGEVDLKTEIGPMKLNFGALSAVMDTVSGPALAKVAFEAGCCTVLDRSSDQNTQIGWVNEVLNHKPCLVSSPIILPPDALMEKAEEIHKDKGFSTIPIVKNGLLLGILFTGTVIYDGHRYEPVSQWMKPFDELKTINSQVGFREIYDQMRNKRKKDSVLPVIDDQKSFCGIYFTRDFINLNPAWHNGRPVVGVAIGENEKELEFAGWAIEQGVACVVIDSSHGNSKNVLQQARRLVKVNDGRAAIIVGNYAGLSGYLKFSDIPGIHAVKIGIGSGAICTTTQGTGVGVPTFTALQESAFVRRHLLKMGKPAPSLVVDGGVDVPGKMVLVFAGGANAFMSGKYFVAADESLSNQNKQTRIFEDGEHVLYRGMASSDAIKRNLSKRYGKGKTAPEGRSGWIKCRGPFKSWVGQDLELIRGGFAHVWARNMDEIQQYGQMPFSFRSFTSIGQNQISTRLRDEF